MVIASRHLREIFNPRNPMCGTSKPFAAMPSFLTALGGTAVWAVCMGSSAIFSLRLNGWAAPENILPIALLFAAGGGLAFAPALVTARLTAGGRPFEARFAAGFLAFCAGTLFLTGFLYGVQNRIAFSENHAYPLTPDWVVEWGFTLAAAFYRFALFGVSLYFPLGLVFLFAASFWHARTAR